MKASDRKAQAAEWARERFVDAAVHLFVQKGFHGATMEEISKAAGYSATAIYRYFECKGDVVKAALEAISTQFLQVAVEPYPPGLDFQNLLAWKLTRLFAKAQENRDFFLGFVAQRALFAWDTSTEPGAEAREQYSQFLGTITDLMKRGIKEGKLRKGNLELFATALIGILNAFAYRWAVLERESRLEDHIDTILQIFLSGCEASS